MSERFTESGMWKIPTHVEKVPDTEQNRSQLTVSTAFCPNKHKLIDKKNKVDDVPGIKLAFTRPNGDKGVMVVSAVINSTNKIALQGDIIEGEQVTFSCPECGAELPVLAPCERCNTGKMVLIYLSEALDVQNSVSFCDLMGCPNAMLIHSDRVIRALEVEETW